MQPLTDCTRAARVTLLGDVLALLAFSALGLSRHGDWNVPRYLGLAAIFVGAWLVTAWAIGTYREFSPSRVVVQIILAITLGVAVRAAFVRVWTLGEILTFAVVAIVFGAFFVGIARFVTTLVLKPDAPS